MIRAYLLTFLLCILIAGGASLPAQGIPDGDDASVRAPVTVPEETPLQILPSAGVSIEGGVLNGDEAHFTGLHKKIIDIHIFRYGAVDGSLLVAEETLTSDRRSSMFYPYRITYDMEYFYLSWRFRGSTLGLLFDHICYNLIDSIGDPEPQKLRWYGAGLKWESNGMKTGRKDADIDFSSRGAFSFPGTLNYLFYAGASLHTEQFSYDYLLRASLRYDFLRLYSMIAYIEGSLRGLGDDRFRVDWSAEAGGRFRLEKVNIIPFAGYMRRHDALLYGDSPGSAWIFGLRMETLLGDGQWGTPGSDVSRNAFSPEAHFRGGYGRRLASSEYGYLTEIGVTIDLFRFGNATLFGAADLSQNSTAEKNSLYPRYPEYDFQAGLGYYAGRDVFADIHYEHGRRHDGNEFRGVSERYHLAGVTVQSRGMKRGMAGYATPGAAERPTVLNRLEWRLFAGRIVDETGYPYEWDLRGAIRWDIISMWRTVPYVSPDLRCLAGPRREYEYGFESGLRFSFGITLMVYHRYERDVDIDRVGGSAEGFHTVGIRLEK